MKRQASPLTSARERKRQDPVSCSLCRSKKLKCSREQPCSNCVSRGTACDFTLSRASAGPHVDSTRTISNDYVLADILARLQRLERAVLDGDSPKNASSQTHSGSLNGTPDLRLISGDNDEPPDKAFDSMEVTTTRDDAVNEALADKLVFGVKPLCQLMDPSNVICGSTEDQCNSYSSVNILRYIWIPPEKEALMLLDDYVNSASNVYHILHVPSTQTMFKDIYARLSQNQVVKAAHMALLLNIIATGAYFWEVSTTTPFKGLEQATKVSLMWSKWALDVLETSRRTTFGSVEDIQATILSLHLITNFEGFTSRVRCLHSLALSMSKDLSIHQLDSPRNIRRLAEKPQTNYIDLEVKRRIWWYLVTTDWLSATMPGPQSGAYNIQPKHMCVRLPKNIDDDELFHDRETPDRPLSYPTTMSYFLVRSMAGDYIRAVFDLIPLGVTDSGPHEPHEMIMMENKANECIQSLPKYFRVEYANDPEVKSMERKLPQLSMQRGIINLGILCSKIRMYRPYLFQKGLPHPYSTARTQCVDAARRLVEIRRSMEDIDTQLAASRTKLTVIVHHTFIAIVVLSLDLCFNDFPNETEKDERREEIKAATKLLDGDREYPSMAARYLAPLVEILQKHKIRIRETEQQPSKTNGPANVPDEAAAEASREIGHIVIPADIPEEVDPLGNSLHGEQEMQEQYNFANMGGGTDMSWHDILNFPSTFENPSDWENLFDDLDYTYTL